MLWCSPNRNKAYYYISILPLVCWFVGGGRWIPVATGIVWLYRDWEDCNGVLFLPLLSGLSSLAVKSWADIAHLPSWDVRRWCAVMPGTIIFLLMFVKDGAERGILGGLLAFVARVDSKTSIQKVVEVEEEEGHALDTIVNNCMAYIRRGVFC